MSGDHSADTGGMASWEPDDVVTETHTFTTKTFRVPWRLRFKDWRRRRKLSPFARRIEDEIGRRVISTFLFGDGTERVVLGPAATEAEYDRLDRMRDEAIEYARDDARDREAEREEAEA